MCLNIYFLQILEKFQVNIWWFAEDKLYRKYSNYLCIIFSSQFYLVPTMCQILKYILALTLCDTEHLLHCGLREMDGEWY